MKKITEMLAAMGGAVLSFFCELPPVIWILIAVMTIDYITGIMCALMNRSAKTEGGGISSSVAFTGLMKKALIILVVLLAALLDRAVSMSANISFEAVAGATCLWFIASEGFSILENVAAMGVPVPKMLTQALEIMKPKSGAQAATDTDAKTNAQQEGTQAIGQGREQQEEAEKTDEEQPPDDGPVSGLWY